MERMVVVGGQEEDETSLLVKDLDGNIIKGVPVGISILQKPNSRDYITLILISKVRVASPHRMEVVSHPYPESKQVLNIGKFYFQK